MFSWSAYQEPKKNNGVGRVQGISEAEIFLGNISMSLEWSVVRTELWPIPKLWGSEERFKEGILFFTLLEQNETRLYVAYFLPLIPTLSIVLY